MSIHNVSIETAEEKDVSHVKTHQPLDCPGVHHAITTFTETEYYSVGSENQKVAILLGLYYLYVLKITIFKKTGFF